ncbi:MAG: hypothetical protein IKM23_05540 [Bacteroidales bacterium]|nr:hypothetical protein [Bacteroidales bacterium]
MKTKFATLSLCMFFVLHGNAQTDGFFSSNGFGESRIELYPYPAQTYDEVGFENMNVSTTPIGGGCLSLLGLGLIYVSLKRKENVR